MSGVVPFEAYAAYYDALYREKNYPELDLLLRAGGFRLVHLCPSGQLGEPVQRETWNATVAAQAV